MATPINSSSVAAPVVNSPSSSATEPALPGTRTAAERQSPAGSGSAAPVETASAPREAAGTGQDLAQATRDISDYIQSVSRSLQISVDRDLGSTIIKVLDTDTDQLIRQIPSEEVLEIARYIAEQRATAEGADPIRGLLLDGEG